MTDEKKDEVSSNMNKQVNPVKESLMRMLKYMRNNSQENLELEVRVGQFSNESEFQSGYTREHLQIIPRLLARLQKNTEHPELKKFWTSEPKYMLMRLQFDNDLRRTIRPSFPADFVVKKRIGKLDILTDRQYHLRVSLSRENTIEITKAHPMYDTVTKHPPKSVRYIYRAVFTEKVPSVSGHDDENYTFNWEISKVSNSAGNKKKSTETECFYHCELELCTKLSPIANTEEETEKNSLLADLILARAKALLGTTYYDNTNSLKKIPDSRLTLLTKDI
jgi:hypothetical protein